MRINSIVSCAAVAFAFWLAAAGTAFAQEVQYLGPSSATLNGSQGYWAYHDACDATFGDSTWCTSKMIVEGGPVPSAPTPSSSGEWINPVYVGFAVDPASVRDFSGLVTPVGDDFNCRRWTSSASTVTGLALGFQDPLSGGPRVRPGFVIQPPPLVEDVGRVVIGRVDCDRPRAVACCGKSARGPSGKGER